MSIEKLYENLNQLSCLVQGSGVVFKCMLVISAQIAQIGQQFKELYKLESSLSLRTSKIYSEMSSKLRIITSTLKDQIIREESIKLKQLPTAHQIQNQQILQEVEYVLDGQEGQFELILMMQSILQPQIREQRFQSPMETAGNQAMIFNMNNSLFNA